MEVLVRVTQLDVPRAVSPRCSTFKISTIHSFLQFMLRITVRCVLHRYWSRVIHHQWIIKFSLEDTTIPQGPPKNQARNRDKIEPPISPSTLNKLLEGISFHRAKVLIPLPRKYPLCLTRAELLPPISSRGLGKEKKGDQDSRRCCKYPPRSQLSLPQLSQNQD